MGFLPTISVLSKYKGNARLAVYKRKLMRKAMAHVTSQITDVVLSPERGLTISVNGKGALICSEIMARILKLFSYFYASTRTLHHCRRKRSGIGRHGLVFSKFPDSTSVQHVPTRFPS